MISARMQSMNAYYRRTCALEMLDVKQCCRRAVQDISGARERKARAWHECADRGHRQRHDGRARAEWWQGLAGTPAQCGPGRCCRGAAAASDAGHHACIGTLRGCRTPEAREHEPSSSCSWLPSQMCPVGQLCCMLAPASGRHCQQRASSQQQCSKSITTRAVMTACAGMRLEPTAHLGQQTGCVVGSHEPWRGAEGCNVTEAHAGM
jgi:hypothetical protein